MIMQQARARAAVAIPAAALSFFAVVRSTPAQVPPLPAADSHAVGLDANFVSEGFASELGPVAKVAGEAPPTYKKTVRVGSFSGSIGLTPPSTPEPTLYAVAVGLKSTVSGGIGVDTISASGAATINQASLLLQNFPPPPATVVPPFPYLDIETSGLTSAADFTETVPNTRTPAGTASFTSLAISGSLLGDLVVGYKGTPPANTVLFQNDTITITINQQVISGQVKCVEVCRLTPTGITVNALDVHLTNADLGGHKVSGDIRLGNTRAEVPLPSPRSSVTE
jgi:hypothetical protein